MGDKLKPGGMGPAGNESQMPDAFANSMAARMEEELRTILGNEGRDQFDLQDNSSEARDRRMLFVAIARGIVTHLAANDDAFKVDLHFDGGGNVTSADIDIAWE